MPADSLTGATDVLRGRKELGGRRRVCRDGRYLRIITCEKDEPSQTEMLVQEEAEGTRDVGLLSTGTGGRVEKTEAGACGVAPVR